jgi:hypothetical protein
VTLRVARRISSLVVLALACLFGSTGWAAASPVQVVSRPPVVLLAVPGLVWADVLTMPHLRALAARSAVGELSVKTSGRVTQCAVGLLAVSAGNRTSAPTEPCRIDMSSWPLLRSSNEHSRFDARVGGLGETLQSAGVTTVAVQKLAVPMLANFAGTVDTVASTVGKALQALQALRAAGVVGVLDPDLYAVPVARRPAARTAVDNRIAQIESELPPGSTLMVAGVSDFADGFGNSPQLHALVLSGPGWAHTDLRSPTTGRAPYVELIDVAPTLLSAVGVRVPSYMVGGPMQASGSSAPAIAAFVDDNRHALSEPVLGQRVFLALGIAAIVMMVLAAGPVRRGHDAARWIARLIAPAPAVIFLANAFPWWRWSSWAYGAIVLAGCMILGAVTAVVARRHRIAGMVAVPVFSVVALSIDQLVGSPLQLSGPLGDNPLTAGRFTGVGNLDFAVIAASALLLAGIIGGQLARTPAIVAAGAIAVVAIVVDGAPQLGNDIGGVLALVPASLVLIVLVAGMRITKTRVIGVVVTTLVVAVGVALADYSRPATAQTHVGRFVGQVLHGGAGTEVRRKLDASLASFGLTVGTFVAGFAVVLAILARHRIRAALAAVPGGTAAAVGLAVVAVLGVAVNDSGITIAALAAIVATSAFYGAGPGDARSGEPAGATAGASG